jgi:hypothetical protein
MNIKEYLQQHPQWKKRIHGFIMHPVKTRPYWWIRVWQPFYIKKGRGSVIYSSVRKDLPPFHLFQMGKYSVVEDFSCLNNAVGDIVIGDYCRIGLGNTVIVGNLPGAILSGKFDYADRILQWFIFPRTILLGILLLFSFLSVYFHWSACLKWWGLLLTFLLTMAIATPNYLVDSKFNKAMKAIPFLAAGMIFNMLLRKKK